jgi:archaellin
MINFSSCRVCVPRFFATAATAASRNSGLVIRGGLILLSPSWTRTERPCRLLRTLTSKSSQGGHKGTSPPLETGSSSINSSDNASKVASTTTEPLQSSATTHVQPRDGAVPIDLETVYVHPLSQIVLQYLQNAGHDWICAQRLDRNLVLYRDGTFMLPTASESGILRDAPTTGSSSLPSSSSLRIWTSYDKQDRRHWLSVSCHQVRFQFLLQDNQLSVWQGFHRQSLQERIHNIVQDLMDAVDELDS